MVESKTKQEAKRDLEIIKAISENTLIIEEEQELYKKSHNSNPLGKFNTKNSKWELFLTTSELNQGEMDELLEIRKELKIRKEVQDKQNEKINGFKTVSELRKVKKEINSSIKDTKTTIKKEKESIVKKKKELDKIEDTLDTTKQDNITSDERVLREVEKRLEHIGAIA